MAQYQTYEGTPSQLTEQLLALPDSQKYRMTLVSEEPDEDGAASLEEVMTRMANRTPEEIATLRERLLAATPPPKDLPSGKSIFDVVMGKWQGNETDEQIFAALEKLS